MNNKIKSIAIEVTDKAFLPESYAYRDYFIKNGFKCDFVKKGSSEILCYDAVILFHGFHPFWKKYPKFIISDYNSLSTGEFSRVKDYVKFLFNVRADLYIFLNEEVRQKFRFSNNINYITRSMGYDAENLSKQLVQPKCFDVVYCGSNRPGLSAILIKLANIGLSIALVGPEDLPSHKNIVSFGRKTPEEAKKIMLQAKYGLNFTPDVFPLNIQDSTKVIEYCAANLGVITNQYKWVNNFEKSRKAKFLTLENICSRVDVDSFDFITPDVSDLEWSELLKNTKIISKIKEL